MKILIVDDQPMMLKTLEIKFVKEGYEVITTTSGSEALLLLAAESIDVVLTEVGFTDSPDFDILKAAKKKDYNIVVIIISIHSTELTIIEAFECGAEEYLIKPVNLNLLSVRIKKLIKVKKMREILARSIPSAERITILRQLAALNTNQIPKTISEPSKTEMDQENKVTPGRALLMSQQDNQTEARAISEKKGSQSKKSENFESQPDDDDDDVEEKFYWTFKNVQHKIFKALKTYLPYFFIFTVLFVITRLLEIISDRSMHGTAAGIGTILFYGLTKDVLFCLHSGCIIFLIFVLIYFLNQSLSKIIACVLFILLILIQLALSQYFLTTLVPLGADFYSYSSSDIKQTVRASGGIKTSMIIVLSAGLLLCYLSLTMLSKRINVSNNIAKLFIFIFFISILINQNSINRSLMPGKEYSNNLSLNKSWFFYDASFSHFFSSGTKDLYTIAPQTVIKKEVLGNDVPAPFTFPDAAQFPFYHPIDTTRDVLSPFFDSAKAHPNIVIILVEGLGRAFTNKNAYLGNFTPFLDSLSEKSIYWENFLSEGGRTFAVLPSVLGSLPFHKTGFNEMGEKMAPHISLLSVLSKNGYNSSFYYGGDAHFDNMDLYLQKNRINNIYDEKTFPGGYSKMPPSESGFSWGYGDKELFRRFFETKKDQTGPYVSVLLTVSTHDPFKINEQQQYYKKFEDRMTVLKMDEGKKQESRNFKDQFASILFMDDAIRGFITQYKQRPDFANTIFIITGDHRMPEIPMTTKIDRYHVPLIIYSPLLKHTSTISSISTHFDITPSLLMLMHKKYDIQIPMASQWIGNGLDTSVAFRNFHTYPFKQVKNDIINDFISADYFMNETSLFRVFKSMDIEPEPNQAKSAELTAGLQDFIRRNEMFIRSGKLIPDSIAVKWGSK